MNELLEDRKENGQLVPRLYPLRQAAKMIGLGYLVLLAAAKEGDLKTVQVGTHNRVTAGALTDYVGRLERGEVHVRT